MEQFDFFEADDQDNLQPEAAGKPRRAAIKSLTGIAAKLVATSIPVALTVLTQKAQAQVASPSVIAALRLALRLEYLMGAYYRRGLSAGLSIPAAQRTQISLLATNAAGHADYLFKALVGNNIAKPADTSYDLSGRGTFTNVLTDYQTYLAVAQVLEDTAVRAYKGLMLSLIGNQIYMNAAMNIHSVRARHAAAIRYIRFTAHGKSNIKPWVSGSASVFNDTGLAEADIFYQGENNTKQAGITITGAESVAIEAFDEPLSMAETESLLSRFNF